MASFIEPLTSKHVEALKDLLGREPLRNLYLLGLLDELGIAPREGQPNFTFWGRHLGGELTAAVFVGGSGGLVVPSSHRPTALAEIAKVLHGRVVLRGAVGEEAGVEVMLRHLAGSQRPTWSRTQRLFSVSADDLGPFTNPTLRLAGEADVSALVFMAAEAVRERLGRNPLEHDGATFAARVRQRVQCHRTYVLESDGRLVFKVDVGCRSPFGAELEGLYTVPTQRRQGHAVLCLGQLSRHLLSSLPRLAMRIDEGHSGICEMIRRVGYLEGAPQRWVAF